MQRPSRTRHSTLIWQRTRVRRNSQLSTSSKAGVSKAAKTGRVGIIGLSGITDLRGTTGVGGGIITTVSFSYMVDGMLGMRASGIPAWGYAPNAYYAYDGPIYGYNSLPPDQVVANVQAALQEQGYYQGEVDGLLGPLTREAIAGYQAITA